MSELEREFLTRWKQLAPDYPEPEQQYEFHNTRRWRLDFAWPHITWLNEDIGLGYGPVIRSGVAVEVHGGTWTQGRHTRGKGFRNDREKINAAITLGWRVFEVTGDMLSDDPVGIVGMVTDALDG